MFSNIHIYINFSLCYIFDISDLGSKFGYYNDEGVVISAVSCFEGELTEVEQCAKQILQDREATTENSFDKAKKLRRIDDVSVEGESGVRDPMRAERQAAAPTSPLSCSESSAESLDPRLGVLHQTLLAVLNTMLPPPASPVPNFIRDTRKRVLVSFFANMDSKAIEEASGLRHLAAVIDEFSLELIIEHFVTTGRGGSLCSLLFLAYQ